MLLAKVSRAKELGIQLYIDRGSCLKDIPQKWDVGILVTVIGNLLENAMEALQGQVLERRKIECAIRDLADELRIEIKDNGSGIPKQIRDQIYKQGFTTKGSEKSGNWACSDSEVCRKCGWENRFGDRSKSGNHFSRLLFRNRKGARELQEKHQGNDCG
ncbi:hypothetical protein GCM10020331_083810 [Ectobacillus funiculus]